MTLFFQMDLFMTLFFRITKMKIDLFIYILFLKTVTRFILVPISFPTTLHGETTRKCQTFPISGHPTYFHIRQKRRLCRNPKCLATSFTVPVPGFRFSQRRSNELTLFIFTLSLFCSDMVTQLICNSLGIQISHDSIRRLLSHIQR